MKAKGDSVLKADILIIRPSDPKKGIDRFLIAQRLDFLAEAASPVVFLRRKGNEGHREKWMIEQIVSALGLREEQYEVHKGHGLGYTTVSRVDEEVAQVKFLIKARAGLRRPTVADCASQVKAWMELAKNQLRLNIEAAILAYGIEGAKRYIVSFGEPTVSEALAGPNFPILLRGDGVWYEATLSCFDERTLSIDHVGYADLG